MRHLILGTLGAVVFGFGFIVFARGLAWAAGVELGEDGRVCLFIFAFAAASGGLAVGVAASEAMR